MSTLDIRKVEDNFKINKIIFSDYGNEYVTGYALFRRDDRRDAITILDEEDTEIILESVEQVENLIEALKKAVELGWVK